MRWDIFLYTNLLTLKDPFIPRLGTDCDVLRMEGYVQARASVTTVRSKRDDVLTVIIRPYLPYFKNLICLLITSKFNLPPTALPIINKSIRSCLGIIAGTPYGEKSKIKRKEKKGCQPTASKIYANT